MFFFSLLHAYNETNNSPLQVPMTLKKDLVYSLGRSKYVAPSRRLVIGSFDDKHNPEYVPLGPRDTYTYF